jgi:hypothetical protein
MALHIWRGSVPGVPVVALLLALGYAANADSRWQLLLVLVMGAMLALVMTVFGKRSVPIPLTVHHE